MKDLNMVQLIGHLGADPEQRSMNTGGTVVSMRLATGETWKDRDTREKRERTEWHQIVIFNEGLGKVVTQYARKGSKLYVQGQLQTRKWQDRDGNDRYSTEVVLTAYDGAVQLLDGRSADPGRRDYSGHQNQGQYGGAGGGRDAGAGLGTRDPFSTDLDDDVPF